MKNEIKDIHYLATCAVDDLFSLRYMWKKINTLEIDMRIRFVADEVAEYIESVQSDYDASDNTIIHVVIQLRMFFFDEISHGVCVNNIAKLLKIEHSLAREIIDRIETFPLDSNDDGDHEMTRFAYLKELYRRHSESTAYSVWFGSQTNCLEESSILTVIRE